MVVSKLIGGLGNQMFQYAVGRHLAIKNQAQLYLDTTLLSKRDAAIDFTFRDFELGAFNLEYKAYGNRFADKVIRKVKFLSDPLKQVNEVKAVFDPQVLKQSGNIYLNGFWQSENYFKDIEDVIRSDFQFKRSLNSRNAFFMQEISKVNAVSIHIRRGDYVTNKQASDFHGLCDTLYYQQAISMIKSQISNPVFYVFSDDFEQVKREFDFDKDYVFVDFNTGADSYNDMRLMAACKHHIIANSSFSWWGAWLNNNGEKIVIAPQRWFSTAETDIVPDKWIKI